MARLVGVCWAERSSQPRLHSLGGCETHGELAKVAESLTRDRGGRNAIVLGRVADAWILAGCAWRAAAVGSLPAVRHPSETRSGEGPCVPAVSRGC